MLRDDAKKVYLAGLFLIITGALVYINSFRGQFIFDGLSRFMDEPAFRFLWPPQYVFFGDLRPLMYFTFALNYAVGQYDVFGYHLVNLGIHICAALLLLGVLRRMLKSDRFGTYYRERASWLAFVTALIWMIHPLQTESVTYIFQRSETLVGMFYFLTLYCFIRSVNSSSCFWSLLSIAACYLGMANKPVMVTAPLMILICDRIFFSASFSQAFRQRKGII